MIDWEQSSSPASQDLVHALIPSRPSISIPLPLPLHALRQLAFRTGGVVLVEEIGRFEGVRPHHHVMS